LLLLGFHHTYVLHMVLHCAGHLRARLLSLARGHVARGKVAQRLLQLQAHRILSLRLLLATL
jgi:hypothetical protein